MLLLSCRGTFAYVVNPKIEVQRNAMLKYYLITAKCFEGLKQFFVQSIIYHKSVLQNQQKYFDNSKKQSSIHPLKFI